MKTICEACGKPVNSVDLVWTKDDVPLHRTCAREIWPALKVLKS